jgi:protein-L-isoaspartate(D-aspartate) O-methyltransferase
MLHDASCDKIRLIMQLRKQGITDTRVLSAMEAIPRELFVSQTFHDKAYDDTALPIENGQTISQPSVVAWMTWALELNEKLRVLEIGTGSGYQAAILSKLCRRVYTIERYKSLMKTAEERFKALNLTNITTQVGDGSKGWPPAAPFDRIIVTAAAPGVPRILLEQLAEGGVMVLPVGKEGGEQILLRLVKTPEGIATEHLMNVRFVPLVSGKVA